MSNVYYRVTSNWTELPVHSETAITFLANVSGVSVGIQLTNIVQTESELNKARPFVLGGTIGEMRIPISTHCYAKVLDPTYESTILVSGDTSLDASDSGSLKAYVDDLALQVMELSKRVTDGHIKDIYHYVDYILFGRRFLEFSNDTHSQLLTVFAHLVTQNTKIFAAERCILELKIALRDIEDQLDRTTNISSMTRQMANSALHDRNTLLDISNRLMAIVPTSETIKPNEIVELNNAIVSVATNNTPEQIASEFDEVLSTTDSALTVPINSIKRSLVDLSQQLHNE